MTYQALTYTAFAKAVGLPTSRISALVAEGLPTDSDGRIDPRAGRLWIAENIDPERSARRRSAPAAYPTTAEARRAKTEAEAERAKLALARERGELVDKAKVEKAIFERARRERDAWLDFPATAAPEIAGELRMDSDGLRRALEKRIRAHLLRLGETALFD